MRKISWCWIVAPILLWSMNAAQAVAPSVTGISPPRYANSVATTTAIAVTFDQPIGASSITSSSFRAYGRFSGPVRGTYLLSNGNRTVTLTPSRRFTAGETVTVNLARSIAASDGSPFRAAGYAWQFVTRTASSTRSFELIDTMTTNMGSEHSQVYGAFVADLDHDSWMDLVTVNEVTADLRVVFNRDDGSGRFRPIAAPVFAVEEEASPNAAGDLNNDGEIDAAVANGSSGTVSVVLGNGNAGFIPQSTYTTGNGSHGLALLDVDGDADWDLVTGSYDRSEMRLRINDGSGRFGASAEFTAFDGGGDGEWPVATGDFNNDGIFDLAVGLANSQTVAILLGQGNRTFGAPRTRNVGGFAWKLALGDLNGDGNLDVSVANGTTGNAAIALGDGAGNLATATTYDPGAGLLVGDDLGDLDGDGDLDWALSSFSAGRSIIYRNNGSGVFAFDQNLATTTASSCTVMFDFDNDGDLDVANFDERSDEIRFYRNRATGTAAYRIGADTSGVFFDSSQSGHGFVFEVANVSGSEVVNVSWFTYADGTQRWLVGSAPAQGDRVSIPMLITSGGEFPPNFNPQQVRLDPWGDVTLQFDDRNNGHATYSSSVAGFGSGSLNLTRLATPVASTVSPPPPRDRLNACHSGSWFDPAQAGHGLMVQVLDTTPVPSLYVAWYVYRQGQQVWLTGVGPIDGDHADVSLISTRGANAPPNFNPDSVVLEPWGTLNFRVADLLHARIDWQSSRPGFGDGGLNLSRLTVLAGNVCAPFTE